jgi:hypothetical protein
MQAGHRPQTGARMRVRLATGLGSLAERALLIAAASACYVWGLRRCPLTVCPFFFRSGQSRVATSAASSTATTARVTSMWSARRVCSRRTLRRSRAVCPCAGSPLLCASAAGLCRRVATGRAPRLTRLLQVMRQPQRRQRRQRRSAAVPSYWLMGQVARFRPRRLAYMPKRWCSPPAGSVSERPAAATRA